MTNDDDPQQKGKGAGIIEHPVGVHPTDPMLEELNVVKLEGRYFCFDLREVPKRKGALNYRDGERGLKIELHPAYGQPSILAYRVLQAAFRKITLEGRPFPETVAFTFRELGRLVGRDVFGGKDSQDIIRAIRQLQRTIVTLSLEGETKREKRWVEFSLVVTSGFVSESDRATPGRLKSAVLTLHPLIIDSMRRGHFVVFNWDRIVSLSPLSSALYKRLYLHLSNLFENQHNKATLRFEKDYEDICGEWLGGLQPQTYKSRIDQQLKPHLDSLKTSGLIRSWSVEKKAGSANYKLIFTPGQGFFVDYELFYHGSQARVLQFQRAADENQIHAPVELTRYFYQRLHRTETLDSDIFAEKDVAFAALLLRRYDMNEARALVDFTLASADSTKFAIKNIRAMETCFSAWEANRERREQQIAQHKDRARKEQDERLREAYESFLKKHAFDQLEKLSAKERSTIKNTAEKITQTAIGKGAIGYDFRVAMEERKLVLQKFSAPTFEAWRDSHR